MVTPKIIRQIILSLVVVCFLLIAAGVGYTYYMDTAHPATPLPSVQDSATDSAAPIPKPSVPAPTAPEGAAVVGISSLIRPGDEASLNVHTLPASTCTAVIGYAGAPNNDSSLIRQTADAYGDVSWDWLTTAAAPIGNWPITVTCVYHGRSAVVAANLQIVK